MNHEEREVKMTKTNYSKPFLSITDLVQETGLSRDYIKKLSRAEGAPIIFTPGGGKIYFRTAELDRFMEKISDKERRKR